MWRHLEHSMVMRRSQVRSRKDVSVDAEICHLSISVGQVLCKGMEALWEYTWWLYARHIRSHESVEIGQREKMSPPSQDERVDLYSFKFYSYIDWICGQIGDLQLFAFTTRIPSFNLAIVQWASHGNCRWFSWYLTGKNRDQWMKKSMGIAMFTWEVGGFPGDSEETKESACGYRRFLSQVYANAIG